MGDLHRRTWEGRKKKLGLEHPDTLTSANNLGHVLDKLGKLEEAADLRYILETRKKRVSLEHPTPLTTSNSAPVLDKVAKPEEAVDNRPLMERGRKLTWHFDPLSNLCIGIDTMEAIEPQLSIVNNRNTLAAGQKKRCPEHASSLTSASNLPVVLDGVGKLEEAVNIRHNMEVLKKKRGLEDPSSLTFASNLVFDKVDKLHGAQGAYYH